MPRPDFALKPFFRAAIAAGICAAAPAAALATPPGPYFERIAFLPAFLNTDVDQESVAEIVAASADGHTLVYTDGEGESIGFVDLSDPADPQPSGAVAVGGEPTSVAVAGAYALVGVNTSPDFVAPSGRLVVVDIAARAVVAEFELGGQPDAVAVSPDGAYAAIAIENERDEDLGDGRPPQLPAGFLTIVDLEGAPADWTLRQVELTGVADLFPEDPEPEYVTINTANIAAVTLQENNHVALVHLPSGRIVDDWSAGTVDLTAVDVEKNKLIELTGSLEDVPREPDGAAWISPLLLATADEGDLDGGGRGFTVFHRDGSVRHAAGNSLEHLLVRLGHYPEKRAGKKGNEPENVAAARYGSDRLLFVGSERASAVAVYRLDAHGGAQLLQVLPSGLAPEGLLPIPQRNLFVTASEKDDRSGGVRAGLTVYRRGAEAPVYPTVHSADRPDATPIPWGALSGLALDGASGAAYTIHDSFYDQSRIYALDLDQQPALISGETVLQDTLGELAAVAPGLVNADGTVKLDLEGIAHRPAGGFWLASEGVGSVDDPARPVASPDLLLRAGADGTLEQVVPLPAEVNARQRRFGYEGVAAVDTPAGEQVYVAFQREWVGDPAGQVRIGRYDVASGAWAFFHYPLDPATSPNGGWVGLSELVYLGDGRFAVIERDNQAGTDAAIKRLYTFDVDGLEPQADPGTDPVAFPLLSKTLARDLLPDLQTTGGAVLEKIEGLAALPDGTALVVNDNDGVDGSNGETQLLRLPGVFE